MRRKNDGKKSTEKSATNPFLYSHEYRVQKKGTKKARNNFSRNTRIVRAKNVGKKIVYKKCEKIFYIHTNIVTKKWVENTGETIFPETHE